MNVWALTTARTILKKITAQHGESADSAIGAGETEDAPIILAAWEYIHLIKVLSSTSFLSNEVSKRQLWFIKDPGICLRANGRTVGKSALRHKRIWNTSGTSGWFSHASDIFSACAVNYVKFLRSPLSMLCLGEPPHWYTHWCHPVKSTITWCVPWRRDKLGHCESSSSVDSHKGSVRDPFYILRMC